MMNVSTAQARIWAAGIRKAADVLNPPGELAAADQFEAGLPEGATLEDLSRLTTIAGGERWILASHLRLIASDIEAQLIGQERAPPVGGRSGFKMEEEASPPPQAVASTDERILAVLREASGPVLNADLWQRADLSNAHGAEVLRHLETSGLIQASYLVLNNSAGRSQRQLAWSLTESERAQEPAP